MANIKPQYTVRKLPDSFETVEKHYKMVQNYLKDEDEKDGFARDENGRKIKSGPATMEMYEVTSKGGHVYSMPRGHSVRLTSLDQMKEFNVTEKARLVDLDTGEEVNEQGVPLSLTEFVNTNNESAHVEE